MTNADRLAAAVLESTRCELDHRCYGDPEDVDQLRDEAAAPAARVLAAHWETLAGGGMSNGDIVAAVRSDAEEAAAALLEFANDVAVGIERSRA